MQTDLRIIHRLHELLAVQPPLVHDADTAVRLIAPRILKGISLSLNTSVGTPIGVRPTPTTDFTRPPDAVAAVSVDQLPRVLLADPGRSTLRALSPALLDDAGYRLVHARSVPEIYDSITAGMAGDLALINVRFHADSPGVIRALRDVGWARVIALTTVQNPVSMVVDAIKAGASGVLKIANIVPQITSPAVLLTMRELQVVRLVADGRSNKEIASRLSISALTVKNHLARIGRKMGAGDRAHIVALACRSGMIIDPDGSPYGVGSEN